MIIYIVFNNFNGEVKLMKSNSDGGSGGQFIDEDIDTLTERLLQSKNSKELHDVIDNVGVVYWK